MKIVSGLVGMVVSFAVLYAMVYVAGRAWSASNARSVAG